MTPTMALTTGKEIEGNKRIIQTVERVERSENEEPKVEKWMHVNSMS